MSRRREEVLVRRFLRYRSERAFRRLYECHAAFLFALALRMTGGRRELAEEAVQEAWLRACERLGGFRWRSSLRTWLAGIVVNCCREASRRERAKEGSVGEEGRSGSASEGPPERLDLERLIARLPEGQRQVLLLHHLAGLTHEEIAERLSIAAGTSKSRLFGARSALRRALQEAPSERGEDR